MNSRRSFLTGLLALPFAPPIIEEVAKGRSFISLYSPKIITLTASEIVAFELDRIQHIIPTLFDKDDVFYKYISEPALEKFIIK